MKKIFALLLIFAIAVAGCSDSTGTGGQTQQIDPDKKTLGSLRYSLGDMKDVNVNITFINPLTLWTAESLQASAKECGTDQPSDHYQNLLKSFDRKTVQAYHFTPKNNPEEVYDVMIVPNAPGYASPEDFKKDFNVCSAGGLQPLFVTKNNLLFTGSCGGAAKDEKPAVSCSDIKATVDPTLELVQ